MNLDKQQILEFQQTVKQHYQQHYRPMPWRENTDPYYVLVSEYMLQQTQVARVLEKFPPFVQAFPNFAALAAAEQSEVLALWSGLGYNRRALFLKRCAEAIVSEYDSHIPDNIEQLCKLPGIGKATAAAILVYSGNKPISFLETNVKTVLIHHFFSDSLVVSEQQLANLAQQVLDEQDSRHWHWALMDYGTWIKKNYGNLTRKSSGYTKQSKFEGSRRQIRGNILKALLSQSKWSRVELVSFLGVAEDRFNSVVAELENEGFILVEGAYITLL